MSYRLMVEYYNSEYHFQCNKGIVLDLFYRRLSRFISLSIISICLSWFSGESPLPRERDLANFPHTCK